MARTTVSVPTSALVIAALIAAPGVAIAQAPDTSQARGERWSSFLPLLAEEAEKRGIELPLPFGAGLVFYHLSRGRYRISIRLVSARSPDACTKARRSLSLSRA